MESVANSLLAEYRKAEAKTEVVTAARNLQAALAVFVGVLERDGGEEVGGGLVSVTGDVLGKRDGDVGSFVGRKSFKL